MLYGKSAEIERWFGHCGRDFAVRRAKIKGNGPSLAMFVVRHHMAVMDFKQRLAIWRKSVPVRIGLLVVGILFLLITPLVGPLPGPGGLITFAIGLGLVLQNSAWARRRYVEFKRTRPKAGGWADWGLRRKSARRRAAREKLRDGAGD